MHCALHYVQVQLVFSENTCYNTGIVRVRAPYIKEEIRKMSDKTILEQWRDIAYDQQADKGKLQRFWAT